MPHLFSDPEFYVLLAVAIFLVVVWKPMRRVIVGALDSRAERIREDLDAARNLRDEAQLALAAYQRQQQEGAAEAQAIIAHAKEEAERIAAQSLRDVENALRRRGNNWRRNGSRRRKRKLSPRSARSPSTLRSPLRVRSSPPRSTSARRGADRRRDHRFAPPTALAGC